MAMIDGDDFAQQSIFAGVGNDTVGGSDNRRSFSCRDVECFVDLPAAGEWGRSVSKTGGNPAVGGPNGRGRSQKILLILKVLNEGFEALFLCSCCELKLLRLFVHAANQAGVIVRQGEGPFNIIGDGSPNTEEAFLTGRLLDICDDPDLFLKLIQGDKLCL